MKTDYINSLGRNYMKIRLQEDREREHTGYQYKILSGRRLRGLLNAEEYTYNGETCLYYDITSKQSLKGYFRKGKIDKEWMTGFVGALKIALFSLEQYLLDSRNLLLDADRIFYDFETGQILFTYYPYYSDSGKQDMEAFLKFLATCVAPEEKDLLSGMNEIYSVWEKAGDEFTAELFVTLWEGKLSGSAGRHCGVQTEKAVVAGAEASTFVYEGLSGRKEDGSRGMRVAEGESAMSAGDGEPVKLYGNGRQNRKVIALQNLPLIIGRKEDLCDVVLTDTSIGKMHVRFFMEGDSLYMEDLNAVSGTYKNNARLKPYEKVEVLQEDEVRFGNLNFTLR